MGGNESPNVCNDKRLGECLGRKMNWHQFFGGKDNINVWVAKDWLCTVGKRLGSYRSEKNGEWACSLWDHAGVGCNHAFIFHNCNTTAPTTFRFLPRPKAWNERFENCRMCLLELRSTSGEMPAPLRKSVSCPPKYVLTLLCPRFQSCP